MYDHLAIVEYLFDFFLSLISQYFRHILQQNEKSTKHRPFDQTKETVSYKKSNFKNGEFIYFGEYYDVRAWFEPYKGMVYYFLSIFFFFIANYQNMYSSM